MRPWPAPLATALGFHKPGAARSARHSRPRASSPRHEQGGSLSASARESARASSPSSRTRRTAVVGLAAPPYGLPSTDPTTPAPVAQLRCTAGPSSLCSFGPRVWSAHADNRTRSEFPLDPLPSRGTRPRRPQGFRTDAFLFSLLIHPSAFRSAPGRRP